METSLPVLVLVIVAGIALVAFLVYQNLKDKKKLEEDLDKPLKPPHVTDDEERI